MPRPLRPIAEGLVYHVINRGNNRQPVFASDGDFHAFLKAIADLKQRKAFDLYGYCLMTNHIHLLLRPQKVSVSRIVQSLLVSHTQRYHLFHRSSGHVWQGRFKSPVIEDDDHLLAVLRYIEANPVRANMVEYAGDYPWSSFACHGMGRPDPLLSPVDVYEQLASYPAVRQRRWSSYVHEMPEENELAAIRRSNETGLPYGGKAWVDRLCRKLKLDLTIRPRGRPRKGEQKVPGTVFYDFSLRGRPWGRKADSKPCRLVTRVTHDWLPKGWPRRDARRNASSSLAVSATFTRRSQSSGRSIGQAESCGELSSSGRIRWAKLDHRQSSALLQKLARNAFRST